jgi:hypothetical protein
MLPTLRRKLLAAVFVSMFLSCAIDAPAQPILNFKRVINNWPTIELYFTAACNGQPVMFDDKRYFTVTEDGVPVKDFMLWCPDIDIRCALSVAFALDAGSAMAGRGNAEATMVVQTWADIVDGIIDEAAVVWCGSTPELRQRMTIRRDLLRAAVDSLPAAGGAALWDGICDGLRHINAQGVNGCRHLIAIGSGRDDVSTQQPAEVIALAKSLKIRVHCIGVGDSINRSLLDSVAAQTGGRYYEHPSVNQIVGMYEEMITLIIGDVQECLITYLPACGDGGTRSVDLTLSNFCGGSDRKTKTYKAPRDTGTLRPLRLGLGTTEARGNTNAVVPLLLLDPIAEKENLYPSSFTVLFDTARARFAGVTAPPGSLLEGVPISATATAGGVRISITDRKILHVAAVPAMLAQLAFTTFDNAGSDTVFCPLALTDWSFSAGCRIPDLHDGGIAILPRTTDAAVPVASPALLELFPDPAPGALTLRVPSRPGERVRITACDALGRSAFEREELSLADSFECRIQLAPAPAGMYFITVTAGTRHWLRTVRVY